LLIGQAILGALGGALTGGIGLAFAVAIRGLFYAFDTKKKEHIESKIRTALQDSRIDQIQSYLKAYQDCFQSVQDA
jgi:hypothetical protein